VIDYHLPPGLVETSFGDGGHWVSLNRKPIRSVSRILNRVWPMPPDLPEWYLTRGKMVHSATCMIDAGTLDWEALDDRIRPFCEAYKAFIEMCHPVVEASELTVVHRSYSYGARLDRVYRLPGVERLIVTDLKTGTGKEDRYWCQVAGCAMALDEDHVADYDLALLNLDKDGRPHFTVENDPATWVARWREVLSNDQA
jgi:hypothetical protein